MPTKVRLTPELRTAILFFVGLGLAVNEVAFGTRPVDQTLLLFFLALMGLGPVLSKSDRRGETQ